MMTPSNTGEREQGSSSSPTYGTHAMKPTSSLVETGDSDVQPKSSGPLQALSTPSDNTSLMEAALTTGPAAGMPSFPIQGPVLPESQQAPPDFESTPRITYSSSSPALSSKNEERGQEEGSDGSIPRGSEGLSRSGVTPPMESASISSDPVPSTVEVPLQVTSTMVRPLSSPHLFSKLHSDAPTSMMMHQNFQPSSPQKSKQSINSLRRGKWTIEEESYVARVIQDFNSGYLNAPAGTTLRSYLSDKLHCDPMRITKKFTGDSCIGKRVFHPAVRCPSNTAAIDKAQAELDALERRWRRRLEMQQRESAKKAAASAAAASAAASGRSHFQIPLNPSAVVPPAHAVAIPHLKEVIVTRTATWLDRANAILATGTTGESLNQQLQSVNGSRDHANAVRSLPAKEIEDQMKEVQRLIHEGPIIQQSTAGLPHLLDQSAGGDNLPHQSVASSLGDHESSQPPVDKRPRRLSGTDTSGAEDAKALVGFLNSVRAAAAADRPS